MFVERFALVGVSRWGPHAAHRGMEGMSVIHSRSLEKHLLDPSFVLESRPCPAAEAAAAAAKAGSGVGASGTLGPTQHVTSQLIALQKQLRTTEQEKEVSTGPGEAARAGPITRGRERDRNPPRSAHDAVAGARGS